MERVIIGVDPHKLSATIEVVDDREQLLGSGRFRTDRAGYKAMRTYAKTWPDRAGRTRQAFHLFSSMLDLAVLDGRLPRNPARPHGSARGVLPRASKFKAHVYLTHQELARLADESGEYRALVLLLGYTRAEVGRSGGVARPRHRPAAQADLGAAHGSRASWSGRIRHAQDQ